MSVIFKLWTKTFQCKNGTCNTAINILWQF